MVAYNITSDELFRYLSDDSSVIAQTTLIAGGGVLLKKKSLSESQVFDVIAYLNEIDGLPADAARAYLFDRSLEAE